jgi:hypothetical protein
MMIGGLEACSALKTALDRKAGEKIKVGGFTSPAHDQGARRGRARIKVGEGDIVRVGAGNYTLSIAPDRLGPRPAGGPRRRRAAPAPRADPHRPGPRPGDRGGARGARACPTPSTQPGQGQDVPARRPGPACSASTRASARRTPRSPRRWSAWPRARQAQGADRRPDNMLRSWANTIRSRAAATRARSSASTSPTRHATPATKKPSSSAGDADFTIVLRVAEGLPRPGGPQELHEPGRTASSSPTSCRRQEREHPAPSRRRAGRRPRPRSTTATTHFWGLTGTPIEKDVSDLHAMQRLVASPRARSSPTARRSNRYRRQDQGGKLGQDEHIARGDKVRAVPQGPRRGPVPPQRAGRRQRPRRARPREAHGQALRRAPRRCSRPRPTRSTRRSPTTTAARHEGLEGGSMPDRSAAATRCWTRSTTTPTQRADKSAADEIEKTGTFDFKGGKYDHEPDGGNYPRATTPATTSTSTSSSAPTRQPRAVRRQAERALRSRGQRRPRRGAARRGVKVFVGHGSMGSAPERGQLQGVPRPQGQGRVPHQRQEQRRDQPAVRRQQGPASSTARPTCTTSRGRSTTRRSSSARRASCARAPRPARSTTPTAPGRPLEQRLQETLDRERRTQDLAANSEQRVAGSDTLSILLGTVAAVAIHGRQLHGRARQMARADALERALARERESLTRAFRG